MGLATVSLIVLLIFAVIAFFVLARVFRAAASRNENRPEAEEDKGYQSGTGKRQAALLVGMALAVGGIISALAGGAVALSESLVDSAVPAASAGILLGVVAYYLGARRLGSIAAILAAAALVIGLAFSQGLVPGVDRTDHNLPAVEPKSKG